MISTVLIVHKKEKRGKGGAFDQNTFDQHQFIAFVIHS